MKPDIAALFDGDESGKQRGKDIESILKANEIKCHYLKDGKTIEDYLILVDDILLNSYCDFVTSIPSLTGNIRECREKLIESFNEKFKNVNGNNYKELSKWMEKAPKELGFLSNKPSKVGIAREYSKNLAKANIHEKQILKLHKELAGQISNLLSLKTQKLEQVEIVKELK